ncbi:MAG: 6-hydroxymethylpterin diphosphokinase MptE-like protein [Spirochaetota bacterium]|nr:6-hydroxymethylpterin diphosphokinase MptE-like protein [Spirochaetota bacterium]
MGKYKLKDTPSGLKTLIYTNSREIKLHSAYNPMGEAQRSVDSFQIGRANLILVCGLGLGFHIQQLRQRFSDCTIVVVERDKRVIDIVLSTYPEFIENLLIINTNLDMEVVFEVIDVTSIRGVTTYYHRPSYMIHKDYYDTFLVDINKYISSKLSDLLTRFEFEEKWIHNILENITKILNSIPVKSLFNKFRNYPGVIVSGGPTLRKNLHVLRCMRDRALIVCVDTAFKVLQKNQISPHLVMTIDSQKHSLKHFLGIRDESAILIADVVSFPRVIDYYGGNKIFSSTSKYYSDEEGNIKRETTPLMDWVEDFIPPIGDIQSGGSVATSAFDLLLNLGCNPIILVGQDLAYTGREIHCSGTCHNDEWLPKTTRFMNLETFNQNIIRKRKIKYVEAYGGEGEVISDFVFDLYRRWFEDSSNKVGIPVINATEGGARIINTDECSLESLLDRIPIRERRPDEILKGLISQNVVNNPESLYKGVLSAIKGISEIKHLSEDFINEKAKLNDKIFQIINEENISKVITPFLKKTYVYLSRHPEICEKRATKMFITDIAAASNKVLKLLNESKRRLEIIR